MMELNLAQRGRALVDWEVAARQTANVLHAKAVASLVRQGLTADKLPDDMEERYSVIEEALAGSPTYRARGLLGEWCAKNHGRAAQEAFEEVRDEVAAELDAQRDGPTTLEVLPHFEPPSYFSKVWFHRTEGGWDAGDYNGAVHARIIQARYLSKCFPGDPVGDRRLTLRQAPDRPYRRILEFGTSSGQFAAAISDVFPEAEVWGVDPSQRMLEEAQRVGNAAGRAWRLFVGLGEDTRFESGAFDMVTAFAVHHELPPRIVKAWFDEAYRLLAPGGVVLFADVARYANIDKYAAWGFDWVARFHGEPYWRASAMLDLGELARAGGFVEVEARGLTAYDYPHLVIGRKPE
jgi:SAM-dependent methyltransferase